MKSKQIWAILVVLGAVLATGCASNQKAPDTQEQYVCRTNCGAQQSRQEHLTPELQREKYAAIIARTEQGNWRAAVHVSCKATYGEGCDYERCVVGTWWRGVTLGGYRRPDSLSGSIAPQVSPRCSNR